MIEKFEKYRWVLAIHLILMCGAYLITPVLSEDTYWIHFSMTSLAWLLVPLYLLFCFWETKVRTILIIFTLLSLNNFVDEILFDPQNFGWNEAIFAITILLTPLIIPKRYV